MKRLLIVEDEEALRLALEKRFQNEYEIVSVSDGTTAISKVTEFRPDIILLDIMLLGPTGGMDVLRSIREFPGSDTVPVVVLTNSGEEKKQEFLDAGANEYLIKANVSLDGVHETIQRLLQAPLSAAVPATPEDSKTI